MHAVQMVISDSMLKVPNEDQFQLCVPVGQVNDK